MTIQTAIGTPYFTRLIDTLNGYIKFYFNRIHSVEGIRYHISCMDRRRKVYTFHMVEMLGQWIITPNSKSPIWIKSLEQEFEKAIRDSFCEMRR